MRKLANTANLNQFPSTKSRQKNKLHQLWSYGSQGKDNQREITAEESSEEGGGKDGKREGGLCHEPKFYLLAGIFFIIFLFLFYHGRRSLLFLLTWVSLLRMRLTDFFRHLYRWGLENEGARGTSHRLETSFLNQFQGLCQSSL